MSHIHRIALPAIVIALSAACSSGAPEQTALDPRLEQDLALASAAAVELAPRSGTDVVSAEELVPKSTPTPSAPAARQVRRSPAPTPAPERIVTPAPAPSAVPAPEPVMVAEAPATEPLPVDGPSATPRPRAPDVIPASGPESGDGGGGWIGVVIRGGLGGVDDCALHDQARRGGRSGVIISINDRIPGVQGTFPNRMSPGTTRPRIEVSRPVSRPIARGGTLRPRGFR